MTAAQVSATPGERLSPVRALSGLWSIARYYAQPLQRFEDARAVSSRAAAFRVLGADYVAFFEPTAVEQVLVTQSSSFPKDQFTRDLRRVLGTGLLTSEGELWRRRRKLAAPSLQRGEIAAYAPVFVERARAFLEECPTSVKFDVHSAMMRLTLDILVRTLFGTRVSGADEVEHLVDALMRDYSPVQEAFRTSLPEWVPVPSRGRLARVSRQLDTILLAIIGDRKRALADTAARDAVSGNNLLTRLLSARDEQGGLNDAALRDEAMTLFLAGHETTALTLTYALRLLAQNPRQLRALQTEVHQVLGARAATMADLPALKYTRAVIDESLRLYPPAWAIGREALVNATVDGVHVPKGTQVILSAWVIQRDPRYFEEPERFWPERWLKPAQLPRFAYFPFGAGPRVCIGNHFALAESALILATFAQSAEFVLEPQPALRLDPAVTLRPRGPVLMRKRSHSERRSSPHPTIA